MKRKRNANVKQPRWSLVTGAVTRPEMVGHVRSIAWYRFDVSKRVS